MENDKFTTSEIVRGVAAAVAIIALAVIAQLVVACSPKIIPPAKIEHSTDTVIRVEVVHDSVAFEVVKETERIITRDTVSHLENKWAESDAVVSDGFLTHTLSSIPQKVYVPYTVEVHDTTVVERKAETVIVEKAKPLTRWQSFQMVLGDILGVLLVVFIIAGVLSFVLKKYKI